MTTTNNATSTILLSKLVQYQHSERLSDYRFAAKLGIPRSLWQLTRTKARNIGPTLLGAVLRTYPELTEDVINFLRDGDHEPTETAIR